MNVQGLQPLAHDGGEGSIEIGWPRYGDRQRYEPEAGRHLLLLFLDGRGGTDVIGAEYDAHAVDRGLDLLEQLEGLSGEAFVLAGKARDVAAGSCERRHEARPNGIGGKEHDDRYRRRLTARRFDRLRVPGNDRIDLESHEFRRKIRVARRILSSETTLQYQVASLLPA